MEPTPKKPHTQSDGAVEHLNAHGYMYLDADTSPLQQHLAHLLRAEYTFSAKRKRASRISGGMTLQTKVDSSGGKSLASAVLQVCEKMLLERLQESVCAHFGEEPQNLRIGNCCFVLTKSDGKGQIPHCDALATNFLTGLVYLSEGTRGTEYWPKQEFAQLPRSAVFDTDIPLLQKVYGEAVKAESGTLLSSMVPVREAVSFGDILLFSPSLLHRGPPSIEERLCFFFSIEREGEADAMYDPDSQNTIDDIALRCFHFDSHEFLRCHDDWLAKQGFSMCYGADIGVHVDAAHARWKEWVATSPEPPTSPLFFDDVGKLAMVEAYNCWGS